MPTKATFTQTAKQYFSGETPTYATVLLGACLKAYGAECLNWDPITLESFIEEDFDVRLPGVVYRQLMSLVTSLTAPAVYRSWQVFDQTVNDLNRTGVDDALDPPTVEEVCWTVLELMFNDPDAFKNGSPFSDQIVRYIEVILKEEGVITPPQVLQFVPNRREDVLAKVGGDPETFQAVFESLDIRAKEIDDLLHEHVSTMLEHLMSLGIEPAGLTDAA